MVDLEPKAKSILDILRQLERLAAYEGPWRPLRDEAPLLRERVRELREREARLDDLLLIALVGGSGVGKSTLLNAIAGDQLARTSEFRPCTNVPTVYHPPGARIALDNWVDVSGSALEHLVIIDTPDSDTIVREHRKTVIEALAQCDLIVICGSPEKYLDEATWSLLRPLQGQRTMVCVETKATVASESVREHWLTRLREQGFDIADYFRLNALRTLDRKLAGGDAPSPEEVDWPRFERFLEHELSRERIRRIKRSNALGLLRRTLERLEERVGTRREGLEALVAQLDEADSDVTRTSIDLLRKRLFAEPHLWAYALAREVSLRAKGILGLCYRVTDTIRSLPARLSSPFLRLGARDSGQRATALLAGRAPVEDAALPYAEIHAAYAEKESERALALARAGFDLPHTETGFTAFNAELTRRTEAVLSGPARERLVRKARLLTGWPATLLFDALPLAFLVYTAYGLVKEYFAGIVLSGSFFVHAGLVFAVIIGGELLLMSILVRLFAWSARRGALKDLHAALAIRGAAFVPERAALAEALTRAQEADGLQNALTRTAEP